MSWLARAAHSLVLLGTSLQGSCAQMSGSDAQCEATLVQISGSLNSACGCANGGCDNGVPSTCDAGCGAIFLPFWAGCSSFVEKSLPELGTFGDKCKGNGNTPAPTPDPGAASGVACQVAISAAETPKTLARGTQA
jgi:hypothetical protein